MGGSVGLKGTDGEMYRKAVGMGARPVTPARAESFLSHLKNSDKITLLVPPGKMGEEMVKGTGIDYSVVPLSGGKDTSANDTRKYARKIGEKVDLLVFVGGDGTARDIYDAVGLDIPVLGVPSGVKMFGAVFAVNTRAAAEIVSAFVEGDTVVSEKEVLDINEDSYRSGRLESKLYGYLKVPEVEGLVQLGKEATVSTESVEENQDGIARYIVEQMQKDTLYLLGAGSTTAAIAKALNINKTLLGVDAVRNNELLAENLNEKGILDLIDVYPEVKIVISPIGGNAFIFGRGNQEFSPAVLKKVSKEDIIIVATRDKISKVDRLRVDTNDPRVDTKLKGFMRVVTHHNEELVMEVA